MRYWVLRLFCQYLRSNMLRNTTTGFFILHLEELFLCPINIGLKGLYRFYNCINLQVKICLRYRTLRNTIWCKLPSVHQPALWSRGLHQKWVVGGQLVKKSSPSPCWKPEGSLQCAKSQTIDPTLIQGYPPYTHITFCLKPALASKQPYTFRRSRSNTVCQYYVN
jgi:hypothetical protein